MLDPSQLATIDPKVLIRFFQKIKHAECPKDWLHGPCWEWQGSRNKKDDYPSIKVKGRWWRVNRWVFEVFEGHLEVDDDAHHECENRACVSPFHLTRVHCLKHSKRPPSYPKDRDEIPI